MVYNVLLWQWLSLLGPPPYPTTNDYPHPQFKSSLLSFMVLQLYSRRMGVKPTFFGRPGITSEHAGVCADVCRDQSLEKTSGASVSNISIFIFSSLERPPRYTARSTAANAAARRCIKCIPTIVSCNSVRLLYCSCKV